MNDPLNFSRIAAAMTARREARRGARVEIDISPAFVLLIRSTEGKSRSDAVETLALLRGEVPDRTKRRQSRETIRETEERTNACVCVCVCVSDVHTYPRARARSETRARRVRGKASCSATPNPARIFSFASREARHARPRVSRR